LFLSGFYPGRERRAGFLPAKAPAPAQKTPHYMVIFHAKDSDSAGQA